MLATVMAAVALATGSLAEDETGLTDYDEPALPLINAETRRKAVRRLKRAEKRSKKFGIKLNRGNMDKLRGERLFKVLEEFDKFVSTIEELPENFVKACGVGAVWFSDDIVDFSGNRAGGVASGEGINLSMGSSKGTIYHEMFHKFERCITDQERRQWDDLNPDDFFYEGSVWDTFAGRDRQSQRNAERMQKRIASGKAKSAVQRREEARSKRERRELAENRANPEIQAAFINGYAQTTPMEDRAEVFRCMMEEGLRFLERARRSEHMRRKMEFMVKLTGKDRYLGRDFWERHSEVSVMKSPAFADGYALLDDVGWRKATPAENGFDQKKLDEIPALIARRRMGTSGRDLITGRSCCYHPASDDGPKAKPRERGKIIPGGEFAYNNWGFNVAASVFETKAETSVFKAFEDRIARPLGFEDWDMSMQSYVGDQTVSKFKSPSFSLSTRDMARIGEAMLRGGEWRGLQVLPRSWVAESVAMSSKFRGGGGFGYMWWVENENQQPRVFDGAFSARGLWGQRITVIPKLDLVIAHKSSGDARRQTRGADYRELVAVVVAAKL